MDLLSRCCRSQSRRSLPQPQREKTLLLYVRCSTELGHTSTSQAWDERYLQRHSENVLAILWQYFDNTFKKYAGLGRPPPTNLAMEPHQWVGHRRTFAGRTFINFEVSIAFGFSIILLFILTSYQIYRSGKRASCINRGKPFNLLTGNCLQQVAINTTKIWHIAA